MIRKVEKPTQQELDDMPLHDYLMTNSHIVTRVTGGWIYEDRTTRIPLFIQNGTIHK